MGQVLGRRRCRGSAQRAPHLDIEAMDMWLRRRAQQTCQAVREWDAARDAVQSTARRRGAPRQATGQEKLLSLWRLRARPLRALLETQSAA